MRFLLFCFTPDLSGYTVAVQSLHTNMIRIQSWMSYVRRSGHHLLNHILWVPPSEPMSEALISSIIWFFYCCKIKILKLKLKVKKLKLIS